MTQPPTDCALCPRLVALRRQVRVDHPDYHAGPVPAFGPTDARLLVVGLAPGMHGANATGRPFTGDHAGGLLYRTLHDFGFASSPVSESAEDGLRLIDCRITNVVKCLPPQNKPVAAEVNACNRFLATELETPTVLVALGGVAHKAVVRAFGLRQKAHVFGHGAAHALNARQTLIDSYHCSRYNTNTRRLTAAMFADVFSAARDRLA
ncbi:uracil-DNA glycosylase [Endozoicomonas sp. G2_2]|uniref:uracil-DNA glycosylase n=1 Tax=Endozoicomonas sp. G2_2 TaxID=2821092 RepID=UPI000C3DA193|nr:uracil-DNA glycosylase [Salinisphaera sp.]MAS10144.1 SPO1 DNA polymerase [Salinisphaera sp.]MBO9469070.1 uracil-DNA glycosylase [Endozoicomonas sp. G2_2]